MRRLASSSNAMTQTRKPVHLIETVLNESLGSNAIDREAGVIRGVKVLGRVSKNGREYSDAAMDDGVRLYEGLKVNVDHPDRKNPKADRGFLEGFGELRNLRKEPSGVFGDLHFLKSHVAAEPVCEAAERFPRQFGLSHNAEGEVVKRGGKWVVESLKSAASVDIVGRPATNEGLFESIEEPSMKTITTTLRSLVEAVTNPQRYKHAKTLLEFEGGDAAGMDMMGAPIDIPAPVDEEPDVEMQIDDAFEALVLAIIRGDGDTAKKLADIKAALELQDSMVSGKSPEASSPPPAGDSPVAESEITKSLANLTALVEAQAKKQAEQDARFVLLESNREVKPDRIKALAEAKDAAAAKALLESWPVTVAKAPIAKPKSGSALLESQAAEKPLRGADFLKALKRS